VHPEGKRADSVTVVGFLAGTSVVAAAVAAAGLLTCGPVIVAYINTAVSDTSALGQN